MASRLLHSEENKQGSGENTTTCSTCLVFERDLRGHPSLLGARNAHPSVGRVVMSSESVVSKWMSMDFNGTFGCEVFLILDGT